MKTDNPNGPEHDQHGDLEDGYVRRVLFSPEAEHWPAPWRSDGVRVLDANGDLVCTAESVLLAQVIEQIAFAFNLNTVVTSWDEFKS